VNDFNDHISLIICRSERALRHRDAIMVDEGVEKGLKVIAKHVIEKNNVELPLATLHLTY